MSGRTSRSSTMEELEKLLNDKDFQQLSEPYHRTSYNANESGASSSMTTPDPLNTAFINETNINEQHSQLSLSQQQQQSQTTKEASSAIRSLVSTIIEQEHELIDLRSPTITKTTTGMMPTMASTGMMPGTPPPTMKSMGTMPRTPPTMKSTGTMPRTPTMTSTGTMPKTPSTIDLVSPTIDTIDLCSPDTSPSDTNNMNSPLDLTSKKK